MNPIIRTEKDGTKVVELSLTYDANGSTGWVIRAFHPGRKCFEWRNSYFDDNLPRWMKHDGIQLVPGKGTPTIAYMDMMAMRMLGIRYGELRTAKICAVHDLDSALHLEWLWRRYKEPLVKLVTHTRIFRSRETPIVQSGHKITDVRLDGGRKLQVEDIIRSLEDRTKIDKHMGLLEKYEIKRADKILWEYDIHLRLEPFRGR